MVCFGEIQSFDFDFFQGDNIPIPDRLPGRLWSVRAVAERGLFKGARFGGTVTRISWYFMEVEWFSYGLPSGNDRYSSLLKMSIEIVDLPVENDDFP